MSYEVSISGISALSCECSPYERSATALDELMDLVETKRNEVGFNQEDVHRVVAVYKCDGPLNGECIKTCGQLLTASLFNEDGARLLRASFMSQVVLEQPE